MPESSFSRLLYIPLALVLVIAYGLSTWLRRQPDQARAQYQIAQGLVVAACVFIIASVGSYFLFPALYPQGFGPFLVPLLFALGFSLVYRHVMRPKNDRHKP